MIELKPCPFCGGRAKVTEDERFKEKSHDFPKWAIICFGCGVRTPIVEMETAVRIWNRRERGMTIKYVTNRTKHKCCCSCKHNIRTRTDDLRVRCNCEIDGHYIGYVENIEQTCDEWKEDTE